MKKYRFRKMWFHTSNNKIVDGDYQMIKAFVHEDYARKVFYQPETHQMWEDKRVPLPVMKVEGFYLVHESLFEEILMKHSKEEPPAA